MNGHLFLPCGKKLKILPGASVSRIHPERMRDQCYSLSKDQGDIDKKNCALQKKPVEYGMRIDLISATNVSLLIGNKSISGRIIEIDRNGKIFFEIKEGSVTSAMEIGKKVSIFFDINGKKHFISGKMWFQPPHKVIITPETDTGEEKRHDTRIETPSLPAIVTCHHGFLRNEERRVIVTNLSPGGCRIETQKPMKEELEYVIGMNLPYHHQQLSFSSPCKISNGRSVHSLMSYGLFFTNMDIQSDSNLKKYLSGEKSSFHF